MPTVLGSHCRVLFWFVFFSSLQDFKQRQGLTRVCFEKIPWGPSLVVQWMTLPAPSAGDLGSVPGWGTKIPTYHHKAP